jgi:hypothetical protein
MLYDDEHICQHCGKKIAHVHFCTPAEEAKRYTCEYCGQTNINHRHICKPKLQRITVMCKNCGAVAVDAQFVCNPEPITTDIKEHWNKVALSHPKDQLPACTVCGQPVSPPGHNCDVKYPYQCEYCGTVIKSGYHQCQAKLGKAQFVCKTCGRLGIKKTDVCAPASIK